MSYFSGYFLNISEWFFIVVIIIYTIRIIYIISISDNIIRIIRIIIETSFIDNILILTDNIGSIDIHIDISIRINDGFFITISFNDTMISFTLLFKLQINNCCGFVILAVIIMMSICDIIVLNIIVIGFSVSGINM
jgi:hypothetical protein